MSFINARNVSDKLRLRGFSNVIKENNLSLDSKF